MAENTDAIFSHARPGCMTSSHAITIKNACKQNTDTDFEFDQPANSIVDGVFVRVVGGITIGGAADIGFRMGTNSDLAGVDIVADVSNGILDQILLVLLEKFLVELTLETKQSQETTNLKFTLFIDTSKKQGASAPCFLPCMICFTT